MRVITNASERAHKSHQTAAAGFERTIQSLLLRFPDDLVKVAEELENVLSLKAPGSAAEWQSVGLFFIYSGQSHRLVNLLKEQIAKNPLFPWAHFAEALAKAQPQFSFDAGKAIFDGAKEKNNLEALSRSTALDAIEPSLRKTRIARKKQIEDRYEATRRDLLGQLETIRSQGLDQEEEQALIKLLQIFPKDGQVQQLWEEFRSKKAIKFLEERSARLPEESPEEKDVSLETELRDIANIIHQSMLDTWAAEGHPTWLGRDFALNSGWQDVPELGLDFLPPDVTDDSSRWLRCELLLRSRRFVDLLSEIDVWEPELAEKPEQIVGLLYLKALGLWGLGHPLLAIELMETIVAAHPSYRSAGTLLNSWKKVPR